MIVLVLVCINKINHFYLKDKIKDAVTKNQMQEDDKLANSKESINVANVIQNQDDIQSDISDAQTTDDELSQLVDQATKKKSSSKVQIESETTEKRKSKSSSKHSESKPDQLFKKPFESVQKKTTRIRRKLKFDSCSDGKTKSSFSVNLMGTILEQISDHDAPFWSIYGYLSVVHVDMVIKG